MSDVRQQNMRYRDLVLVPLDPPLRGLQVVGDLDIATVAEFESALSELAGDSQVTLDLSELSFIDSTGMRAIFTYARSLDGGAPMVLVKPSKIALRAFEIVGLTDYPAVEIRKD